MGQGKTPLVQHDAEPLRLFLKARAGLKPQRQHHHVMFLRYALVRVVDIGNAQVFAFGHFFHRRRPAPDVRNAHFLRAVEIPVKILAVGAHVHVINGDLGFGLMLFGEDRFLCRGHAADRGTVIVVANRIAGPDALDKRDMLRRDPVRRPAHVAAGRTGRGKEPFELGIGKHVFVEGRPELDAAHGVERLESRREQHCPHVKIDGHRLLVVIDGARAAHLGAQAAFPGLEM